MRVLGPGEWSGQIVVRTRKGPGMIVDEAVRLSDVVEHRPCDGFTSGVACRFLRRDRVDAIVAAFDLAAVRAKRDRRLVAVVAARRSRFIEAELRAGRLMQEPR